MQDDRPPSAFKASPQTLEISEVPCYLSASLQFIIHWKSNKRRHQNCILSTSTTSTIVISAWHSSRSLLKLKPYIVITDSTLERLAQMKKTIEADSGNPFWFLGQIEDPNFLYVVGS